MSIITNDNIIQSNDEFEINVLIGQNLRLIRREQEMSQTQLGIILNVSLTQVQKYEKALCRLPIAKAWLLCKKLNKNIDEFFLIDKYKNITTK